MARFLTAYRSKLDNDVRDEVQIKIIHGSWKKEDSNRIGIEVLQAWSLYELKGTY